MTNLLILLADASAGQSSSGSAFGTFIPLILIVVVFYFFMIRPQMKKNKDLKKFREALGKGDKIITIGGIHGKIIEVQETTFIIETEGQTRLKIEKSAVGQGLNADALAQK